MKSRTWIAASVLALAIAGCNKKPAPALVDEGPPQVDARRLTSADHDAANWMTHGRTYSEQRFSPLKSIDVQSVRNLKLAWHLDLPPNERGEESTPLVVDGAMYVTTSWSRVLALDAATGKVRWRYDPRVPGDWGINACCDVVNRGVAFWEGKVYVGTLDGRLIALDAATGKPLWETIVIDRAERASITGAPRIVKGRVFIGSAGGEFGVRGRLTAVDANTGAILWRFFTVPGDPSISPENLHLTAAQKTWTGQWWARGGGGTVWDAMAYDPAADLIYIGTGNGSPWPRSLRSPAGGDNLYISSIIALRAETGEYVWHYQTTPGDEWGFDAASQLVLADLTIGSQRRAVLIQAAANGFVYVLDRITGELISATAFVPVNWTKGIHPTTWRPEENSAARYSHTRKPFVIQPSPRGAHSWHPMAFNPKNGMLYIPAMLNTAELSVSNSQTVSRYALNSGTTSRHPEHVAPDSSQLIAWDPVQRKAAWTVDRTTPLASGVVATAGSLIFQGSTDGKLRAFHADTGELLWTIEIRTSVTAAPITYEANGTQFLAVIAGSGGAMLLDGGHHAAKQVAERNVPRLLAFSLQGAANLPNHEAVPLRAPVPERFGTQAQVTKGKTVYARYCARCHGESTFNAGPLRDLKHSERLADSTQWQLVVHAGLLSSGGMPGFMAELNLDDVESLRAYVAHEARTAPRAP